MKSERRPIHTRLRHQLTAAGVTSLAAARQTAEARDACKDASAAQRLPSLPARAENSQRVTFTPAHHDSSACCSTPKCQQCANRGRRRPPRAREAPSRAAPPCPRAAQRAPPPGARRPPRACPRARGGPSPAQKWQRVDVGPRGRSGSRARAWWGGAARARARGGSWQAARGRRLSGIPAGSKLLLVTGVGRARGLRAQRPTVLGRRGAGGAPAAGASPRGQVRVRVRARACQGSAWRSPRRGVAVCIAHWCWGAARGPGRAGVQAGRPARRARSSAGGRRKGAAAAGGRAGGRRSGAGAACKPAGGPAALSAGWHAAGWGMRGSKARAPSVTHIAHPSGHTGGH